MLQKSILAACLTVAAACWFVTPAYAYLDPGTGSMLLQALIGGIAAAGAMFSVYYGKLKATVAKWRGRGDAADPHKDGSP